MPLSIDRIDHVVLNCRDVETTVAWYQRVLGRSEEHTSELQSLRHLVCRLLLENVRAPPRVTLFPYTTLFRSARGARFTARLEGETFPERRLAGFHEVR